MHGQFNCYTVMFISSFSHVRLSLDNKRLLTYLLTYLLVRPSALLPVSWRYAEELVIPHETPRYRGQW